MKKIFTLVLVALSALSASAVTLWEGSCSFSGWGPIDGDERPVLKSSDFATAAAGDQLVLTISEYGEESWREAQIYGWNGEGSTDPIASSGNIAGLSSYTFTLDEELLAKLQATDVCIIGTGYTITKIDLDTFDGTIWEGECVCENWDASPAVNLKGSAFVNAKLGDVLVFTVEVITPGSWAALQVNTSNWVEGPFGQNVLTDGQTEVRFTLDETLLESLTTEGINITGANFKLYKIQLVSDDNGDNGDNGDDGDDENDDTVIWSGTMTTGAGGWDNTITLGGDAFAGVQAGDILAITVSEADEEAQVAVRSNPGWGDVPSDLPTGDYIPLSDGPGVYQFPINQELSDELSEKGIVITGTKALTITKVQLIRKGTATGVEVVKSANDASVYNIQGLKVADRLENVMAPGLYIVGGKKIIIK